MQDTINIIRNLFSNIDNTLLGVGVEFIKGVRSDLSKHKYTIVIHIRTRQNHPLLLTITGELIYVYS